MSKYYFILGCICFLLLITGTVNSYNQFQTLNIHSSFDFIDNQLHPEKYFKVRLLGAVNHPGIVPVSRENPRLLEAIVLAGGLSDSANTDIINLSENIENAMTVYIPFKFNDRVVIIPDPSYKKSLKKKKRHAAKGKKKTKYHKKKKTSGKKKKKPRKKKTNKTVMKKKKSQLIEELKPLSINPNTATMQQLTLLPGIGEKIAQRIINYRNEHPITSQEDLLNINGIGDKKLEKILPYLIFE